MKILALFDSYVLPWNLAIGSFDLEFFLSFLFSARAIHDDGREGVDIDVDTSITRQNEVDSI